MIDIKIMIFIIASAIVVALIIVGDIFYILKDKLWIKSVTSAGFVILGAICLTLVFIKKDKKIKFPIIMFVGLIFAMFGDIILEVLFIVGAILFAIGHIFYFVSYCFILKFQWMDLIPGSVIFVAAVLFITLAPIFDFDGVVMEVLCIIYAFIISFMVGKSIYNLVREKNVRNIIIMVGSLLFFVSDAMLLLNVFAHIGRVAGILCLSTYYPGQIILALSIGINEYLDRDKSETSDQKEKP